jgi:GTP-binding protein
MQAPKYAQPGKAAKELEILLELKVIADVGLIGFPNVGKSTLLSRVTNAKPKIANYHFTTLNPNLGVVDMEGGGFVIADIPGLIEGASDGIGLGHEFLRHIERTKVLVHLVDIAGTEGRDPIEDIYAINKELENYNQKLEDKPQIIVANKIDALYIPEGEKSPIDKLKDEFEPKGMKVFPISAVAGKGIKELLYYINDLLKDMDDEPIVFEQEYFMDFSASVYDLPYTVEYDSKEDEFVVEGKMIDKMLGYTNIESEKGFIFFQKFLRESGIIEELENQGVEEGDTIRMYGLKFDYYK